MARNGASSLVPLQLRLMTALLTSLCLYIFPGDSHGADRSTFHYFKVGDIRLSLPAPDGFSAEPGPYDQNEYLLYSALPPTGVTLDSTFPYREALTLPGYIHPIFTEESFVDAAKRIEADLFGENGGIDKAWPLSGEILTRLGVTPDMVSRRFRKERAEFFVENAFSLGGQDYVMQHSLNLLLIRNKILILRSAQIYGSEHRGPTLRGAVWDWIYTMKLHEANALWMSLDSGVYQEFEAKHEFHITLFGKMYTFPYPDPVLETFFFHPSEKRIHSLEELSATPGDVKKTITFHEYPLFAFVPEAPYKDPKIELAIYSEEFERIYANTENLKAVVLQRHSMENEEPSLVIEHDAHSARLLISYYENQMHINVHFFTLGNTWASFTFTSPERYFWSFAGDQLIHAMREPYTE